MEAQPQGCWENIEKHRLLTRIPRNRASKILDALDLPTQDSKTKYMSTPTHSDFVLFSHDIHAGPQSKMLAVETVRSKQSTYFHPMAMDPNTVDMFSYPMDVPYPHTHTDYSRVPQTYFDAPVFAESDFHQTSTFPSIPTTPPSAPASYSAEHIPTGSAASGPSIASAPSSALGSPYSGNAQVVQDNWMNTNHGLGLPAAVMSDLFANDYSHMGASVDMDGLYQEKFPDTFVGKPYQEWALSSGNKKSQIHREPYTNEPFRPLSHPTRPIWSWLHSYHLLP